MSMNYKEELYEQQDNLDEFSDIIRNKMTDKQFWSYVAIWKDADALCDEMEQWDTDTKIEALLEVRKIIKRNKK